MKDKHPSLLAICFALATYACTQPAEDAESSGPAATGDNVSMPSMPSLPPVGGSSGGSSSGGAAPTIPPAPDAGMPCEVSSLLRERCGLCHGPTPQFGATFSLTTAANVRARGARILARINDDQKPMPPPPNMRLSAAERMSLAGYIQAGAPESSCNEPVPPSDGGGEVADEPADPNVTCYQITARSSKANDKFVVPTTPDLYHCFNYAPPWGNRPVQMVSSRPLIDNSKVLHHWLLYNGTSAVQDGSHSDCVGAHPNTALVAGWAPGGEAFKAPPDVGVEVANGGFVLEVHYNNSVGEGQMDGSGVEVCVTDKPRPNVAAMHWLGTQQLNKTEATGTCVPTNRGDVTILRSTPHMHLQGRHMKTMINRAGGGADVLLDQAFDFNTQVSYSTPAVVHPGDTLTTTCTYAMPTAFGEGTNNEMCYNFVLAYPAGGLAQSLQLLRKYDCAGLF